MHQAKCMQRHIGRENDRERERFGTHMHGEACLRQYLNQLESIRVSLSDSHTPAAIAIGRQEENSELRAHFLHKLGFGLSVVREALANLEKLEASGSYCPDKHVFISPTMKDECRALVERYHALIKNLESGEKELDANARKAFETENEEYLSLMKITNLLARICGGEWSKAGGSTLPALMPESWIQSSGLGMIAVCGEDELEKYCTDTVNRKRKAEGEVDEPPAKRFSPLFYVETNKPITATVYANGKRRYSSDDDSDDEQWYEVTSVDVTTDYPAARYLKCWSTAECLDAVRSQIAADYRENAKTACGSTPPFNMAIIHWLSDDCGQLARLLETVAPEKGAADLVARLKKAEDSDSSES